MNNEQALTIVNAVWGYSPHAESQALTWAALVAQTNSCHRFSEWSAEEAELVRLTNGNPDMVAALGHQTPEAYLLTKEAEAQERLRLYEPK